MSNSIFLIANQIAKSPTMQDIIFYVMLAVLVIVVVVICLLYTKSKRFKLKEELKFQMENKPYEPPTIITVEQKEFKGLDYLDD